MKRDTVEHVQYAFKFILGAKAARACPHFEAWLSIKSTSAKPSAIGRPRPELGVGACSEPAGKEEIHMHSIAFTALALRISYVFIRVFHIFTFFQHIQEWR